MPGVAHDLLVWDAVPVGRGDEAGTHPVRCHRFQQRSLDPGRGPPDQDLPDGIRVEAPIADRAPLDHPAEDRPVGDVRRAQPCVQRLDRAGVRLAAARDPDLSSFASRIGLGAGDGGPVAAEPKLQIS